jgi:hypothetical protein
VLDAGFAVHLLLPLHYQPSKTWNSISPTESWVNHIAGKDYLTYPLLPNSTSSRYDVIAQKFQAEVIKHLVGNGIAARLAVIYVANEFDFVDAKNLELAGWPGCGNSLQCKKETLAYTTNRVLGYARAAAQGKVPVGIKFAGITDASAYSGTYTQLPFVMDSVMKPNSDVIGLDVYWDLKPYDSTSRAVFNATRLAPFTNGRFELNEWARTCRGYSTPSTISDAAGLMAYWPEARGYALFAWNSRTAGAADCYAMYDTSLRNGAGGFTAGGDTELRVLRFQAEQFVSPIAIIAEGAEGNTTRGWLMTGGFRIEKSAYSANNSAYRFRCDGGSNGALVSPAVDLTGFTSATLTFYEKYDLPPNAALYVEVSLNDGPFITIAQRSGRSYQWDSWTAESLSLKPYVGTSKAVIRFRSAAQPVSMFGVTIDDIRIAAQ